MRQHRFRLRTLMATVAATGLLAFAVQMHRRSVDYRARALAAAGAEETCRVSAETSEEAARRLTSEARDAREPDPIRLAAARQSYVFAENAAISRSHAGYQGALRQRYEWAASHPWESLAPEPPRPH